VATLLSGLARDIVSLDSLHNKARSVAQGLLTLLKAPKNGANWVTIEEAGFLNPFTASETASFHLCAQGMVVS